MNTTNEYANTKRYAFWCGGKYGSAFLVTGLILKEVEKIDFIFDEFVNV